MSSRRTYFVSKFAHIFKLDITHYIPINMEKGIFNSTVEKCRNIGVQLKWGNAAFVKEYVKCGQKVLANVTYTPNSGKIKEHIISGVLKAENVGFMTHKELYPELWAQLDLINKAKYLTKDVQEHDGLFKCGKCKSKKTTYTQVQTRSADEPMTTFVLCSNCENRWKC
jgi:DNA-directed RNA polymerase subunit M/transcription elongation factor TFIIS